MTDQQLTPPEGPGQRPALVGAPALKKDRFGAIRAVKKQKQINLHVTCFPPEGGAPFPTVVQPDDEGLFELDDHLTYRVTLGSVWEEDGKLRAIVNLGNPQTIRVQALTGSDVFHPLGLNSVVNNNLWVQANEIGRRKPEWKKATTWAMGLGLLVLGLLLAWQVQTTGDGFEGLKDQLALLNQQFAPEPAGPATDPAAHRDIAPRR